MDKTPIAEEVLTVTVTDSDNQIIVDDVVKTDSNGDASLELDLNKGKYVVSVSFDGGDNFVGNSTTQKLTIKEKVLQATADTSSDTPYDINNLPPSNDPYPETNRYYLDEYHVKQEYADGYMRSVDIRTGEIHGIGY